MEKKTPLLDEIGRKHGMKVPGNYFADFTEKMTESLPEREFPELVQPSLWLRVRPWIYMAAMFAGIWLMMKMFTGIFSVEKGETPDMEMTASATDGSTIEDEWIAYYVLKICVSVQKSSRARRLLRASDFSLCLQARLFTARH